MNNKKILKLSFGLVLTVVVGLLGLSSTVSASDSLFVQGSASVDNTNGSVYFDQYNADVTVDPSTGVFTGFAWSEDLGWIDFDNNGEADSVVANTATGVVRGLAHVVNTDKKLDFTNYNSNVVIDITNGTFSGHAWSEDLGWIDFTGVSLSDSTYPFDITDPNSRITDIGLITNIPDLSDLTYYFTSTTPKIKGQTEKYSEVYFKLEDETFTTTADSKGYFTIQFDVGYGENEITYYAIDRGENQSEIKTLTLITGEENFPDWVIDILYPKEGSENPDTTETDQGIGVPDEDTQEEIEGNKILVVDEDGKTLKNTKITVDGIEYLTDKDGYVASERLAKEAVDGVYTYIPAQDGEVVDLPDTGEEEKRSLWWLWLIIILIVSGTTYYFVKNRGSE